MTANQRGGGRTNDLPFCVRIGLKELVEDEAAIASTSYHICFYLLFVLTDI